MMRASGRTALILIAGFMLLCGGPAQAAPEADAKSDSVSKQDTARPGKHRRHESRRSRTSRTARTSSDKARTVESAAKADRAKDQAKPDLAKPDQAKPDDIVPASSQLPPAIANANAQLAAADAPAAEAASAMTDRANENIQIAAGTTGPGDAEGQVIPADQVNDLDRTVQQGSPPAQTTVMAATEAQPRPAPVIASNQQSSAWDQSSLIGKIFIGVGTLLTLASAARMFMA